LKIFEKLTYLRPPGSGKTKTITAIVGAILSSSSQQVVQGNTASKKLLVCAPSNAAVDELVMRFKQGIKTLKGQQRNVNVVRIGRSDAINANVQDVTLERLVNKRLGVNNGNGNGSKEDTQKIFDEHKKISAQVRELQDQLNSGMVKGPDASKMQNDLNILRKQKASLGTKIDNVKDEEKVASRTAELNRRRAQEAILGEAHVICATLSGSGHDMFQGLSIEFETVIVDEAAQCVEMSALIPLKYGCAKCILVGDPKQLPPTVFSKEAARFQYEQSLFVRMQANHPDDVHLLDTQYRMHPDISLFPSQTFYDGRLLDGPNMAGLRKRPWHDSSILAPYRFFDVQGQHQSAPKGHSLINLAEIAVAKMLYKRLVSDYADIDFRGKIGIITPYKSQLRELKLAFAKDYGDGIIDDVEFNTTDAFQGRESEVIIFSCVRASPAGGIGFLQDIRRMNVGLTRAKSSLWVLGNSQSLMRGEFWRKLVEDARRREQYTEGNLFNMLNKHSSKFPAKKNKNAMPRVEESSFKPPSTSWIPVKRDDSELMDFMFDKPQPKPEIKQESVKQEEEPAPQGVKRKASTEDVDMLSPSESPATPDTGEDGTPGAASDTGVQPAPGEIKTEAGEAKAPSTGPPATAPPPGDIIGGMAMAKPKIRRKRPDANPLLVRKKPRPG
jgi:senataxin